MSAEIVSKQSVNSSGIHQNTTMPVMYTPEDIRNIFKISRNQAYSLMASDGFPSFKINRRLFVEDTALRTWIARNQGTTFFV